MYTGTLIEDLIAAVDRAEENAREVEIAAGLLEVETWLATLFGSPDSDSILAERVGLL